MKIEKFLKKHPECKGYKVFTWYPNMLIGTKGDVHGMELCAEDVRGYHAETVVRVVGVNHEESVVWVVKGNV